MILKRSSHLDSTTLGFWDEWCQVVMCHRHLPVLVEKLDFILQGILLGLNSAKIPLEPQIPTPLLFRMVLGVAGVRASPALMGNALCG